MHTQRKEGLQMKLIYENIVDRYHFSTFQTMVFPAHLHSNIEIVWLEQGELQVIVNNQSHLMTSGDLFIAFPHQIHQYAPPASDDEAVPFCQGIMIICPVTICGDFQQNLTGSHPGCPFLPAPSIHPDVVYALHSLLQTTSDIHGQLMVIQAYIQLILARTMPLFNLQKNKDSQPPSQTALLIQYISEHFTEPLSLDLLASELHVSKYCISRMFSDKLHTSFTNYVNTLRIDYAKKLLVSSELDILTISEYSGYDNPRTFNREFRTLCGCSPREFRRLPQ